MLRRWLAICAENLGIGRNTPVARRSSKASGPLGSLRTKTVEAPKGDFRAVSVTPRLPCCNAVEAQQGKRYLLRQRPDLPLPNCSMPARCRCRYQPHPDRRKGERRSPSIVWPRLKIEGIDRRTLYRMAARFGIPLAGAEEEAASE